jgi:hypothetical protein
VLRSRPWQTHRRKPCLRRYPTRRVGGWQRRPRGLATARLARGGGQRSALMRMMSISTEGNVPLSVSVGVATLRWRRASA